MYTEFFVSVYMRIYLARNCTYIYECIHKYFHTILYIFGLGSARGLCVAGAAHWIGGKRNANRSYLPAQGRARLRGNFAT